MFIGYMRVSKSDGSQVFDLQRDALLAAGVIPERIYEDLASGCKDDRPGLAACLKALQSGNTLVVWKLDRLGRDLKQVGWAKRSVPIFSVIPNRCPVNPRVTHAPNRAHRALRRRNGEKIHGASPRVPGNSRA